MAREFSPADLSPDFKVNGTHAPDAPEYAALHEKGFADWRLRVDGLVVRPLDLSLADLRAMPQRAQITGMIASRLERHRQMAGRATRRDPETLGLAAFGAFRGVSLRRFLRTRRRWNRPIL